MHLPSYNFLVARTNREEKQHMTKDVIAVLGAAVLVTILIVVLYFAAEPPVCPGPTPL
jgi:hypothetical protein